MDPIRMRTITLGGASPVAAREKSSGQGFQATLESLLAEVNGQLTHADGMAQDFAAGKRRDLHEIMIATEKASLSFRFLLQIRNKLLEAYQEIIRMQL